MRTFLRNSDRRPRCGHSDRRAPCARGLLQDEQDPGASRLAAFLSSRLRDRYPSSRPPHRPWPSGKPTCLKPRSSRTSRRRATTSASRRSCCASARPRSAWRRSTSCASASRSCARRASRSGPTPRCCTAGASTWPALRQPLPDAQRLCRAARRRRADGRSSRERSRSSASSRTSTASRATSRPPR